MSRRKQTQAPKVPRSTPIIDEGVTTTADGSTAQRRGPREITPAQVQAYTNSDLKRIALFGGLILTGMFALKFMGL